MFARDASDLAADGWVPVTQLWVADDWPLSAYIVATILVLAVIGIFLLMLISVIKPVRTLMVTYHRSTTASP